MRFLSWKYNFFCINGNTTILLEIWNQRIKNNDAKISIKIQILEYYL